MASRIKDVASLANVSSATVSRVLTQKTPVSDEVRSRVLKAVEELGYQPSRVARSLRVRSSQIIGLIISDIQNPFFTSLVRAVEDQAYANNYAVFLCNTDENIQKEELYINLMLSERVAGVIITPTNEINTPVKKLKEAGIPVVVVDRRISDMNLDTVVVDNVAAAHDLVAHLIEQGHRRIGAIFASQEISTGHERYQGYLTALAEYQISLDPSLIRTGVPKEDVGYQYASELLDLPEPPTALFTGNNLLTVGALRSIRDRNLRIPEDLSLVGFDDMEWSSLISPRLTVVAQPTYEIGQKAADLILKRINNPSRPIEQIILKHKLQIRESTAFPAELKGGGNHPI